MKVIKEKLKCIPFKRQRQCQRLRLVRIGLYKQLFFLFWIEKLLVYT